MFALPQYLGFNVDVHPKSSDLIDPPGVDGKDDQVELKGTYGSNLVGAQGPSGDLGTTSRVPSFDRDAGRDDFDSRRAVVDGKYEGGIEDPLYGDGTAAHLFARLSRHGSTVQEALARVDRKRQEGEFPPLPKLDLPALDLAEHERIVLIDYLDNLMEHMVIGHEPRCSYSREHCKARTGMSEWLARDAIGALRMKGLMDRVGVTRGTHAMDPYLYEPRRDLLELILQAMPDYRALSSEEEPSTSTVTDPIDSQITDVEQAHDSDLEEVVDHPEEDTDEAQEDALVETDQELVGASTERQILRPSQGEQLSVTPGPRTCSGPGCSNDISHLRAGAQTCSARCRMALSRSKRKILEPQERAESGDR